MSEISPVSRREREKLQRRQAILDAAERVIALRGFHGASMDQIAQEAEFAPGTLYLYFKDKNQLYAVLFLRKLTEMVEEIEEAGRSVSDPLDGLRKAIRAQFEFNDRNREFFEVLMRHRPGEQNPDENWVAVHQIIQRHHAALYRLVECAQELGFIRTGDSRAYANALLGAVIHTSHELVFTHTPLTGEPEFIFNLFLNGARLHQAPQPMP
ncbi:MAG: TetR/AcrR family transcriptional regulator [Chthoniobacteraceae bacterium]